VAPENVAALIAIELSKSGHHDRLEQALVRVGVLRRGPAAPMAGDHERSLAQASA